MRCSRSTGSACRASGTSKRTAGAPAPPPSATPWPLAPATGSSESSFPRSEPWTRARRRLRFRRRCQHRCACRDRRGRRTSRFAHHPAPSPHPSRLWTPRPLWSNPAPDTRAQRRSLGRGSGGGDCRARLEREAAKGATHPGESGVVMLEPGGGLGPEDGARGIGDEFVVLLIRELAPTDLFFLTNIFPRQDSEGIDPAPAALYPP